jgi:hypothetical protein
MSHQDKYFILRQQVSKLKDEQEELRGLVSAAWDEAIKDFPEDSRQWTPEQNQINSLWCNLEDWI